MNLVVIVPDGTGARNFLLGPFLHLAGPKAGMLVLHPMPDDLVPSQRLGTNGRIRWKALPGYREGAISLTLRQCLSYAHMFWADTQSMRHNRQQRVCGSWSTGAVHHVARLVGRVCASPRRMRGIARCHCFAASLQPEVRIYRGIFEEFKPSLVFCSNQKASAILPAVLAAKSLGIPTATFIFSWDNLTSKGRIAAPFDHYLVWSDLMRQELLRFYPDVARERVHIIGTPQFDPYAAENLLWSREEFFRLIGADTSRPLICYSGGVSGICPEDPEHVGILLQLVRQGRLLNQPQVLLRPAPVDDYQRFDVVRREFPELFFAPPKWVHSANGIRTRVIPRSEDVQFLANLTHHADLNVNMASTMTLDFAVHDKPIVNIAFDTASPPPFGIPVWDFYYRFEHYRPVVELGAARFARSPEQLAEHINAYLRDPSLDREGRRRLVDLEVGIPIGQSSRKLMEVLEHIAS